jgi:hypothetical protein
MSNAIRDSELSFHPDVNWTLVFPRITYVCISIYLSKLRRRLCCAVKSSGVHLGAALPHARTRTAIHSLLGNGHTHSSCCAVLCVCVYTSNASIYSFLLHTHTHTRAQQQQESWVPQHKRKRKCLTHSGNDSRSRSDVLSLLPRHTYTHTVGWSDGGVFGCISSSYTHPPTQPLGVLYSLGECKSQSYTQQTQSLCCRREKAAAFFLFYFIFGLALLYIEDKIDTRANLEGLSLSMDESGCGNLWWME